MSSLKLLTASILLFSIHQISAQKTYKTDRNFTSIDKYGSYKVEVFKYKKYYEVLFYNDSEVLCKKAKYQRDFEIESMPFENRFIIDTVYNYYRNGKVKSLIPYEDGYKNGTEVIFYDDGSKKTIKYYKKGIQKGEEISYYKNGEILCKGNVSDTKTGCFLISNFNEYYKIGDYQSNALKKIEIISSNKELSSSYLFKDTLDIQIIDSVIIYKIISSKIDTIKYHFKPGYRNLKHTPKEDSLNKNPINDSSRVLYYKYSDDQMKIFLENNLSYPNYCRDMGIQGTTYIFFIVSKEGFFIDVFSENSMVHQNLKDESLRVIKLMEGDFIQKSMYPSIGVFPLTYELDE